MDDVVFSQISQKKQIKNKAGYNTDDRNTRSGRKIANDPVVMEMSSRGISGINASTGIERFSLSFSTYSVRD